MNCWTKPRNTSGSVMKSKRIKSSRFSSSQNGTESPILTVKLAPLNKDTFIPEEKLDTMLSALEVVSETWESNGLFTGTIRTEINLTARQIFDTRLITKDAEMAKLYEIILQPFREHLEATLGPNFRYNHHKFTVRLCKYVKGGKQPLHSDTIRCGCL